MRGVLAKPWSSTTGRGGICGRAAVRRIESSATAAISISSFGGALQLACHARERAPSSDGARAPFLWLDCHSVGSAQGPHLSFGTGSRSVESRWAEALGSVGGRMQKLGFAA
ncbi:MAG TPA: hypothetical protein VMS55_05180 [Myxococcota bacterium]|nr:hypothetical protein [Myxococcota bacterium]